MPALQGPRTEVIPAVKDKLSTISTPSPEPQREESKRSRSYMTVGGTLAPVDDRLADSGFCYDRFTSVAGPQARPRGGELYQVQHRGIHRNRREWVTTRLIALVLVVLNVRRGYLELDTGTFASKTKHGNHNADSITEDMATSLKVHAPKNEIMGRRWRSQSGVLQRRNVQDPPPQSRDHESQILRDYQGPVTRYLEAVNAPHADLVLKDLVTGRSKSVRTSQSSDP